MQRPPPGRTLVEVFVQLTEHVTFPANSVEDAIKRANTHMALACGDMSDESLDIALMMPSQKMSLELKEKNIMSVRVPEYDMKFKTADEGDIYSYGFGFTSGDLDGAVKDFADIMPLMLRLAETEKTCQLLASEIEKTRRRVNALEHVMIPDYEDTIKYITMKLEEAERSNITRLLKIKDMMLQQTYNYE